MAEVTDVLVVGLGPVGAVFSSLCAKNGITVIAVERDIEVYKNPRAVQIDFEVLRQLNFLGVADDVLEASTTSDGYEFINRDREILMARYPPKVPSPTNYPFANLFHQPTLEHALRRELARLEEVTVYLGTTLTEISQDESGILAKVESPEGTRKIQAQYAIACDGASSSVRKSLGIGMRDLGFDEPWVVVDVLLPEGMRQLQTVGVQLCDPARPTTSVLSGPGRHRWEFMLKPGEDYEAVTNAELLKSWIADWTDPDQIEIERSAVYEFHGLLAEKWRDRRILLIGDAAHQMPPFFGQGLCSGVRDASNLAWKLHAVMSGRADEKLLDTVQIERDPHVAGITEGAIEMGRVVCIADEAEARDRDQRMMSGDGYKFPTIPDIEHGILDDASAGVIMPEPMTPEGKRLDDVVGARALLVTSNALSESQHQAALSLELEPCSFDGGAGTTQISDDNGYLKAMMGETPALLAKPDRIVFGSGEPDMLFEKWRDYLAGELT